MVSRDRILAGDLACLLDPECDEPWLSVALIGGDCVHLAVPCEVPLDELGRFPSSMVKLICRLECGYCANHQATGRMRLIFSLESVFSSPWTEDRRLPVERKPIPAMITEDDGLMQLKAGAMHMLRLPGAADRYLGKSDWDAKNLFVLKPGEHLALDFVELAEDNTKRHRIFLRQYSGEVRFSCHLYCIEDSDTNMLHWFDGRPSWRMPQPSATPMRQKPVQRPPLAQGARSAMIQAEGATMAPIEEGQEEEGAAMAPGARHRGVPAGARPPGRLHPAPGARSSWQ